MSTKRLYRVEVRKVWTTNYVTHSMEYQPLHTYATSKKKAERNALNRLGYPTFPEEHYADDYCDWRVNAVAVD